MTEAQLREELAPRVAAKFQSRLRGHGLGMIEAEQLAHEVIAMVQAATLAAQLGDGDGAPSAPGDHGPGLFDGEPEGAPV